MRQSLSRLAALAFVLAAMAVAQPARAQDDIGSNPITELFSAFGMGDKEKPEIDYRERPALVPPPSVGQQLPPPQQRGAVGQATGQWPLDPDEERRAAKRAEDNLPMTETRAYRMDRNPVLPPSEIIGRRTANREGGVGGYTPTVSDNTSPVLSPSELRGHRQPKSEGAPLTPGVEPTRARLTDPPAGYRAPSANAGNYVAAAEPAKKPWYKKINPFSSE